MYGNRGKQPRGPVKVQKTKPEKNLAQIKSKERVAAHGEVFTAEREVNAMLDLVKQETERIDSRFLEPACGTGNFLVKILERKLDVVKKKYRRSPLDFERNSVLALSSIYGVDILADNAETCRDRLFKIWNKAYKSVCKTPLPLSLAPFTEKLLEVSFWFSVSNFSPLFSPSFIEVLLTN